MLIAYEIRSVPGYKGKANQNRCEQEAIYSREIDRERSETSLRSGACKTKMAFRVTGNKLSRDALKPINRVIKKARL